jgi:hypothetical protein
VGLGDLGRADLAAEGPGLTNAEKRWAWIFAGIVMAITTIPYFVAYSHSGGAAVFSGSLFGVEDGNSYIAKMLSGSAGAWLFRSPYTASPQAGIFAFFPYLLLGKLAAGPGMHDQLVALFHLFRIAAGMLDIFATYTFLALFVKDVRLRRLGTALAALGGGLGWVLVIAGQNGWLGSLPLDFYSPETFGFLEIYGLPHLALARALLFIALIAYLNAPLAAGDGGRAKQRPFILAGIFLLLTSLMQPLTALIGWLVIGVHQVVHWVRRARVERISLGMIIAQGWPVVWVYLLSCPVILYTAVVSLTDPFMKAWTAQNTILSPNPLHYLAAFGLVIVPAVLGLASLAREDFWKGSLLLVWAALFPFLAYFPYNLQRRLPEGIWVVWLAGVMVWMQTQPARKRRLAEAGLFLTVPTTVFLLMGSILAANQASTPIFRPAAEVKAFEYLAAQPGRDAVVLASYDTGNALPAWVPAFVVIGHGPESIHLSQLREPVSRFYQPGTPAEERLTLLREFNVDYFFRGPLEAQLGEWDPGSASFLKQVYNQDGYAIYQVELGKTDP